MDGEGGLPVHAVDWPEELPARPRLARPRRGARSQLPVPVRRGPGTASAGGGDEMHDFRRKHELERSSMVFRVRRYLVCILGVFKTRSGTVYRIIDCQRSTEVGRAS